MSPYIIEKMPGGGERHMDIFSRLLMDRIIYLYGQIGDGQADELAAQLFFLEADDPGRDIIMYINSPGGSVTAGMAIYDAMQYISCDIATVCIGQAASMAAVILAAGTKGKRTALPNSRMMIHQPLGGAQGQAKDMEIQVKEINRMKKRLNDILSFHTGQPLEVIERDTDRDFFLTAEEAVTYGLVDRVVQKRG